jgi:hypothetical protein
MRRYGTEQAKQAAAAQAEADADRAAKEAEEAAA